MTPERYTDPSAPRHGKHHLHTPAGELSHEQKLARQAAHVRMLSGALILTLLMLGYAAAFDLNSWPEWVVLGGIVAVAIGAFVAVGSRNN